MTEEKQFKDSIKVKFDIAGLREHSIDTAPVVVYKIKNLVLMEQCKKL